MANEFISRLYGTLQNFFRIGGSSGIGLKNNSGTLQVRDGGDSAFADVNLKNLKILNSNAANGVTVSVPGSLGANITYVLPGAYGSQNQVLADTDGAGTLGWVDAVSGAALTNRYAFTQATSSPLTLLGSPPDNAVIRQIRIEVETAAGGGGPTIEVGVSGTTNQYVLTTESDLLTVGVYVIDTEEELGASPADVIATITPDSQTFSGYISITYKP